MKKPATICFPMRDGKVWLARKKRGFGAGLLNGYGGKQLESETIAGTALRETQEEGREKEGNLKIREEDFEKVAEMDFSEEGNPLFYCHVYLIKEWEGAFHETEEMGEPVPYDPDKLPYNEMETADRFWVPLIVEGKKIHGKVDYEKDRAGVKSFTWEPLHKSEEQLQELQPQK